MGLRGVPPTPSAILKLRGSRLANRPGEPQPEQKAPSCPSYLTKAERQVWRQLAKKLERIGVLTIVDQNALARYCVLFVRWRKACDFLEAYGTTQPVKDGNGNVKCFMHFPQVSEVNKLSVLLLRLEQEFGLTPSSRTRIVVNIPKPQPIDNKGRFFGQTG